MLLGSEVMQIKVKDFIEKIENQAAAYAITYLAEERAGHAVSRNGVLQVTQFIAQHLA